MILSFLAKATVLIGLWLLVRPFLNGSPAARRGLGIMAFAAALAIPILEAMVPRQIVASVSAEAIPAPAQAPWLVYVWLAGVIVCLANLAIGWWSMRRMLSRSTRVEGAPEGIVLREAEGGAVFTAGILRPSIVLPRSRDWDQGKLRSILLHEVAHVENRDVLWQTLAYLVCALGWFNPVLWLGRAKLAEDAEGTADAAVLRAGVKPCEYARTLHSLAAEAPRGALGIRGRSSLAKRVAEILVHRDEKARWWSAPAVAAVALLLASADVGFRSQEWLDGFRSARNFSRLTPEERMAIERSLIEQGRRR